MIKFIIPTSLTKFQCIVGFVATPFVGALLTISLSSLIDNFASHSADGKAGLEWYEVFSALLVAPLLETLLFQSAPFAWATAQGKSLQTKILLMSIPFALIHAHRGFPVFLETFAGGLILATVYVVWSAASRSTAFVATALTHFLHNAITLAIMLQSGIVMNPIVIIE